MLSQEKCHDSNEIKKFIERTNDSKYVIDLKLDGISIALKYKHGKLIQAVTRPYIQAENNAGFHKWILFSVQSIVGASK